MINDMNKSISASLILAITTACTMQNPLLTESPLDYGAPQFDKIKAEHYMPAFRQGIKEMKAEVDAIVTNPDAPTFENTILALEESGSTFERVSNIFFNLKEADTSDELEAIAEEMSPLLTEAELYVSLNAPLFEKVKAVYAQRDSLPLEKDQQRLLENCYKSFSRGGANLSDEDKERYGKLSEELSLLTLRFSKNALAATNAFTLHIQDSTDLAGLPSYVIALGAQTAQEKGLDGWAYDLSYPSYASFMKFSERRELRRQMYMAYNSRALGGEYDNSGIVKDIIAHRIAIARLLGYKNYAAYALENRMVRQTAQVNAFIDALTAPSLPAARKELEEIAGFARSRGFAEEMQAWDFSYWAEQYKNARYDLNEAALKPYFRLENCIDAVFGLATRLYGLRFIERQDLPVYHPDVKVYDVCDADGTHLALFYADFFPRASKRNGAWMTEFRGQEIVGGVEHRPVVSIVTNFSKPTADAPSLLTHDELTTFLHEFGHSLHGMLARGRYGSLCGTSVARDFVELPSQIMENWAFEPEYLESFAKDYRTEEVLPQEQIGRIVAAKNYLAAYYQVRQLDFGRLDMAWHDRTEVPEAGTDAFEKAVLAGTRLLPAVEGTCISTAFSHIFSGGYAAGYYSYKWAEVLEADAFSLFQEKGIFNQEVAGAFRREILERGSNDEEAVLYRNFRGHDPEPDALLKKLGIIR